MVLDTATEALGSTLGKLRDNPLSSLNSQSVDEHTRNLLPFTQRLEMRQDTVWSVS
jgi:hypothetical protein